MNARKPAGPGRRPARPAGKNRTGKSGARAAAGLVGSAAAITGAGIAAWMLPATAVQSVQAVQADDGATQAATLTAFMPPPASTVPASPLTVLAQAPPAPSGAPPGTGQTVNNGLEPTASWLERSTAPGGALIMPDNQLAIHYPPDASVPNCENGCTKVFQWVGPTHYPDLNANPPQINDANSAMNWAFALPAEKQQFGNFLVPPGTTYSTLQDGLQQPISPDGAILGGPDYVFGFSKGILLMPTAPDKIPMSALPPDDPGSTAYSQLAATLGIDAVGRTDGTSQGQQPAPGAPAGASDPTTGLAAIAALTFASPGASATGNTGDTGPASAVATAASGSVTGATSDSAVTGNTVTGDTVVQNDNTAPPVTAPPVTIADATPTGNVDTTPVDNTAPPTGNTFASVTPDTSGDFMTS
jgi:hypothetical protein